MKARRAKSIVVVQYPYCAVKKRQNDDLSFSYDMWEWNVWKLKWVRLSMTGSGFGEISYADQAAKERNDEIEAMLRNNQTPPPRLDEEIPLHNG